MGLIQDLGLEWPNRGAAQRAVTRIARTGLGSTALRRILEPTDRLWAQRTDGRSNAIGVLAGLPTIDLRTTGAKTGAERSSMLVPIPFDGDIAVLGTNFGSERTPGWVYNLEADPRATITFEGTTVPVVAHRAEPEQTDRIFEAGATIYAGYADYRQRTPHREIRAFVLTALD